VGTPLIIMAYSKKVIEKFENTLKNPSAFNVGRLDPKKKNVGTGMVGAPACGDVMRLQIEVNEKNVITDCKFKTYGCGSAIASSQQMIEMMKGKTIEEAKKIKDKDIAKILELPPIKIHCSVLAEDSIKQAIADYESKKA
jgi:nitrogen fixation NifU-like protein